MRAFLLAVLVAAPAVASAQPAPDSSAIAEQFGVLIALAHADDVAAALAVTACPIEGPDGPGGRPVAGSCDDARADHRARVEHQLALIRYTFPESLTTPPAFYRAEREGREEDDTLALFHLLLFQDLSVAPYALVSFIDVDDTHLFAEVQMDDMPDDLPAPPSLVAALDRLLLAAADLDTTPRTFAPLLAATEGADAWRVPASAEDPGARPGIGALLVRLRGLMDTHGGYEVVGFETDRESEGEWHVLHVRFDGMAEGERMSFAFLPIGADFLLGDVDG